MAERLYRHFSADGTLLYIGVSSRIQRRIREHATASAWFDEVARIELTPAFPDRESVLAAEREAVGAEQPKYNKHYKTKPLPARIEITAAVEREKILARVVNIEPLYRESEVASLLHIYPKFIRQEIEAGRLGYIDLPSPKGAKMIRFISGWQIIDWLETVGLKPDNDGAG